MKKISTLFLFILFNTSINAIELSVSGAQQAAMPLAIIIVDKTNNELNDIAAVIKKDLQFTDQFKPYIKKCEGNVSQKAIQKHMHKLSQTGTPLAIYISTESPNSIKWQLYDTMQNFMITDATYVKNGTIARAWAHATADQIWKTLTNNDGFFSSRLAYCKDSKNNKGHTIRKVYVTDFDGSNAELLVDKQTICIGPRWQPHEPGIAYSEYANTNVELMSISMDKKRKPIANYDGINMLASFSPNGTTTAYCSSRGSGSCQIYLRNKDTLKRCTKNSGNNTSPIFIDEDHLCFCSDFQSGNPQIYIGNIQTGHLQRITAGGYCTSPSYCSKTHKIAYHKMINGTMQIMMYNCATKEHVQLTKTNGNKHEVSFSPCGTQLLFAHEIPNKNSRIGILNLLTNKIKLLTNAQEECSYPHWSPCYKDFPVVT